MDIKRTITGLLLVGLLAGPQFVWAEDGGAKKVAKKGAKKGATEPDYTKGEAAPGPSWEASKTLIALGPLGAFARIWGGCHGGIDPTDATRMIQIRFVEKGTPADGVLKECDVILGIGNKTFTSDARKALGAAITEAEKKENGGKLVLNIWRPATETIPVKGPKENRPTSKLILKQPVTGKTMSVTMTLPVKGSYSTTSPWNCEKTKTLIDDAAQAIVKKGFFTKKRDNQEVPRMAIDSYMDAVGLLATGEETYVPVVRNYARAVAKECEGLDIMKDKWKVSTWNGAYRNLFLTEYYLATNDEAVLPGITDLSTYFSMGQSGVGTWSHGMADVTQNGLFGPASAYGAMNSCSVVSAISLVLAQKCGIKKKEIDDAVQRSLKFYRWFVDKGVIPYGDHAPGPHHDNNGRNSMAAVFFDLVGEKEPADFFTRMTLASYNEREAGHTGHFFSEQWGAVGAARGGPEAAHSFISNVRWYTELERRPDGGQVYQSAIHKGNHLGDRYPGWSTTGTRLLQHCLPRKAIYLTGKGGYCITPITGDDLKTVVAAATFDPAKLTVKELLAALGNWSVIVRDQAAKELGTREENVVKELMAMLNSPDRYARYGACMGLAYAGRTSEPAVDALMNKIQSDKDLTMRRFAVMALKLVPSENGLGEAARKSAPALLKLAATYEPEQDPMRKLHAEIANLMFYGGNVQHFRGYFPNGEGSEKIDRSLLIPALKSWLTNPNGAARSAAAKVYPYLSEDDLKQLWGPIYHAVKKPAPSGVMFAGGVRMSGLDLMAKHHVKEGIEVGVDYTLRLEGWGNGGRKKGGIPLLLSYGKALEDYVPEINKVLAGWLGNKAGSKNNPEDAEAFKKRLAEALQKPAPELISIKPYIDAAPDPLGSAGKRRAK